MTREQDWTRRLGRLRRELDGRLACLRGLREMDERREDVDELLAELDGDHGTDPATAAGGSRGGPADDRAPQAPTADDDERDEPPPPRLRASG